MERGFERIISRERDKGLLTDVSEEGIRDFAEFCAVTNLMEGGVPVEVAHEMAAVVMPDDVTDDELDRLVTQMGQIALFTQGTESDQRKEGNLRFAQEALEHYLVARHIARDVKQMPQKLERHELPDNVLRLIASCVPSTDLEIVWNQLLANMSKNSAAGRNSLHLVVYLSANTDRLMGTQFAGLDLSRVRFSGHSLRDISFDGADLTNSDFSSAELTGASFENCIINGTRFAGDPDMLNRVQFGGMRRFYSAYIGERFVNEVADMHAILGRSQDGDGTIEPACSTARQLRDMFGKFVAENGDYKRKDISRRALLRGRQIVRNREEICDAAVRHGYLVEHPHRPRVSRSDDLYPEMRRFRMDLEMSSGLRDSLDATCENRDCAHVQ